MSLSMEERRDARIQRFHESQLENPLESLSTIAQVNFLSGYIKDCCVVAALSPTMSAGIDLAVDLGIERLVEQLLAHESSRYLSLDFECEPIVSLAVGPAEAMSLMHLRPRVKRGASSRDEYLSGRRAQLEGSSWTQKKTVPKQTIPHFRPYLDLIEAVASGNDLAQALERTKVAFEKRMSTSHQYSMLVGSKDFSIVWDHFREAILAENQNA